MHGVSGNSPLPPSVETAYYRKCIELKRRINEIEENNDAQRVKKLRIERGILKMRIERSMLLEQIANKMKENPDDSDDSNSPPPTVRRTPSGPQFPAPNGELIMSPQPQDKPLRSKRGHRKLTPPPGGASTVANSSPQGGTAHGVLMSQELSTPDVPRQPVFREYVPPGAAAPVEVHAPHANGAPISLPSISSQLPPSITTAPGANRSYAYDDRTPNGDAPPAGFASINQPARPSGEEDTEMGEDGDSGPEAGGLRQ